MRSTKRTESIVRPGTALMGLAVWFGTGAQGVLAQPTGPTPVASSVECPGLDYQVETGLAGQIRERDEGITIPNAFVVVSWVDAEGARNSRDTSSGIDGVYTICGLPTNVSLTVRASFADYSTEAVTVTIEPGPPAGWDFEIDVAEGALRGDSEFPGRIVGTVFDRGSERPVDAAELELVGDNMTRLSDGNGRFLFEDLTPGLYRLSVDHITYDRMEQVIQVPGNRTVEVRFNLSADPIELEPLVVTVVRDARLELRGYYDRREMGEKLGNGVFFNAEEIARIMPSRVTNLLSWVPGVRVDCSGGIRNCTVQIRSGQPSLSVSGQAGCSNANVYVDGMQVIRGASTLPESIDNFVHPSEISGMEVYRGASELPAEFGGSTARCGAIVIWTGTGN